MKQTILTALLIAGVCGTAMSEDPNLSGAGGSKFIVQGHRGAGVMAPENTVEAFELGWKMGLWPEADVRATTDNVIVAFHDNNFQRVVRDVTPEMAKKGVEQLTWDELQKLDVGETANGEFKSHRVPKLTDIFQLMKGKPERHLYLDIKKVNLAALAKEVKEHGVEKQIVLASSNHALLCHWRTLVPGSETLLWMGGTEQEIARKLDDAEAAEFEGITQAQIHVHLPEGTKAEDIRRDQPNAFSPSDEFVKNAASRLKARGILVQSLPYGGTSKDIYLKLMDLGVQSFATDQPTVTLEAMNSYRAEKKQ